MAGSLIKKAWLFITAIVVAGLVAGCGGGGDSASSTAAGATTIATSSRSKGEFLKLANAICNRERTRILTEIFDYLKVHKGEGKNRTEIIGQAEIKYLLPEIKTQVEEIRVLGAPRGEEQKVEAILSGLQKAVDAGDKFKPRLLKQPSALAEAYGLLGCNYI